MQRQQLGSLTSANTSGSRSPAAVPPRASRQARSALVLLGGGYRLATGLHPSALQPHRACASLLVLSISNRAFAAAGPAAAHGARAAAPRTASQRLPATRRAKTGQPGERGGISAEEVQQAIATHLGPQHCLKSVRVYEVRQLPSLPLVQSRVVGLRDQLGAEAAAALLGGSLDVLRAAPADVRERLGVLAAACGCDLAAAVKLCSLCGSTAQLLRRTPQHIELALTTLWECLGLQTKQELHKAVRDAKRVLLAAPEVVRERHAALGRLLGLDSAALAALLRREPMLLGNDPAKVEAGVAAVRDVLELDSWEEAVEVATRCPVILICDPQRIVEVVAWLKDRLGLSNTDLERFTFVFTASAARLEESLQQLPQALCITPAEAARLAQEAPHMLKVRSTTVAEVWVQLKEAAALQPVWRDQLLASSPATLTTNLSYETKRLRARIQRVAQADPPPDQLPALSSLSACTDQRFDDVMRKVQAGTFKARRQPPAVTPASIASSLPTLAAQLRW